MLNKRERATVEWCIDALMDENGDFAKAIGLLHELLGKRYPAYHAFLGVEHKLVPLHEIKEGPFRYPGDGKGEIVPR